MGSGVFPAFLQFRVGALNFHYPRSPAVRLIVIIIILFIERHIQQAVRGALQHSKAVLSVIINIQVNYF